MTNHWKAVKQYFTVVLFTFQIYPVCNFGKFSNFGLVTVRSERFYFCLLLMDIDWLVMTQRLTQLKSYVRGI